MWGGGGDDTEIIFLSSYTTRTAECVASSRQRFSCSLHFHYRWGWFFPLKSVEVKIVHDNYALLWFTLSLFQTLKDVKEKENGICTHTHFHIKELKLRLKYLR